MPARTVLLAGVTLACAACSRGGSGSEPAAKGQEEIACALNGEKELKELCPVERVHSGNSLVLIVRHPDGGFRRFVVESDGTGIAPADGAASGNATVEGNWLILTVDDDRYRFPMTRTDHSAKPDAAHSDAPRS